jgi:hypothetical protein
MNKHNMHDMHHHEEMVHGESSTKEYIKFALVLITIVGISAAINTIFGDGGWMEFMRWFMGVFLAVFASFKFLGYRMFAQMFAGYDVIAKRFMPYAYAYPFIEVGLAVLYLGDIAPLARDIFTVIFMSVSAVGVLQEIRKKSGVHCACLGNVIKLPLSTVSLIEDVGMGGMALIMLLMH